MAKPRINCVVGVGAVLIVIGAAILIMGIIVTPKEFPKIFNQKLNDYLVIDSDHAEQYDNWAGQNDVENPYYLLLYMYNLTNVPQVIQRAATPLYDVVGPYMYRRYHTAVNVSFLDNGNKIQYSDFVDYVFDANASNGLSDTDVFININPVYIGALMQANVNSNPAEQNLVFGLAGGMLKSYTGYFTESFVSLFTAYTFPSYFTTAMDSLIAQLNSTNNDPQQAYTTFVDSWRNSTTAPNVGNWSGILLSTSSPAGISSDSANALLNASVPFSLLNTNPEAIWYWDQCKFNYSILVNLCETFKITTDQAKLIWQWRNTVFGPTIIYPDTINNYGIDQISDIGWVQWTTKAALNNTSVFDTFEDLPSIGYFTTTELGATSGTWSEWRTIMNNSTGLENITNYQAFMKEFGANGMGGNFTPWGLDSKKAQSLIMYILQLLQPQVIPTVKANVGSTGGLFTTRTVSEWAFNCNDYVLNLLRETPPMCSFRANHSGTPLNIINSGKSDLSKINTYEQWQGQSTVTGVWAGPVEVEGHTELGQFPPRHFDRSPLSVFQDDLARTVYLNFSSNVTVSGISADRYVLDFNRTFGANSLYYQSIAGVANMTSLHNGSPIFLSLWGMLNVDNSSSMVIGLNSTDEFYDSTVVDIEPTTGIAIQSRKRMQINLYVPHDNVVWFGSPSFFGNEDFTTGILYPLAQIGEYGTIDTAQASKLQSKLSLTPRVKHVSFYIGVTTGPLLVVLGFLFIFMARRKQRDEERQALIN